MYQWQCKVTITYFIVCDWHVQFSLFFKCSVSCGIGIQVRKIDCVLPVSVNGSHPDHLHSRNTAAASDDNNNNEKNDRIELSPDTASNGPIDESIQILSNEQISMDCDPKLKPIATQSCTTGIECTTIINDNIDSDSSSHEEPDTITNGNENENDNGNENVNSKSDPNENDNTDLDNDDENTSQESDNDEGPEDMGPGQNVFEASVESTDEHAEEEDAEGNTENVSAENGAAAESEEVDETEVFFSRTSHT